MQDARSVAEALLYRGSYDCVRVFLSTHLFSREMGSLGSRVSRTPASGCAYGSLTLLLFSYIDSVFPLVILYPQSPL